MTTIPTIGFNVENVEHKHFCFNVWDIGGGDKIRPLWRHYFHDCHSIVFVADCENREIITEVWDDLKMMVDTFSFILFHFLITSFFAQLQEDALKDVAILVLANKQDLAHSMSVSELEEKLDLRQNLAGRRWHIQATSATQGTGLREGFDWLADELAK